MAQNKYRQVALGIDIGATKIASGLVSSSGKISALRIRKTPRSKPVLLKALHKIIESYPKNLPVGVGIAGHVLPREGLSLYSPNFSTSWKNVPLQKILAHKHGVPVAINNDAKCFAIAENKYGAGKRYKNYIVLTWGTGIGGGIIINNKLFPGTHNTAGEFGHTMSPDSSALSSKRIFVHSEYRASGGQGLPYYYKKLTGKKTTNQELIRLWRKKDKGATRAVQYVSENFGIVLASVINSFNPEALIIGGGLSSVRGMLEIAIKTCRANAFTNIVGAIPIKRAQLGEYANVIGAGYIARHKDY